MKFDLNKKGELTTQQLVVIIILIISFVVILFLLWRLNLGETTNKEICHNSVVMAGKKKGVLSSLDCRTTYVCISGGEPCNEFNPTTTIEINLNDKNAETEILEAIQKEIDDCWWMFGEGKIDYVSGLSGYYCAICSMIKFDEKIQNKFPTLNFNDQVILTNEKYSVITGMNDNVIGSDKYINAQIIKSDEIDSKIKCDKFISKA